MGADVNMGADETGAEARRMDASPRCGEANLKSVWPGSGGPLCYSGVSTMSPLVLASSSSSSGGLNLPQMKRLKSRLCAVLHFTVFFPFLFSTLAFILLHFIRVLFC